jgi:hypothetical protein
MTVTPTDPAQDLAVDTTTAIDESTAVEATADQADFGTDEDLSIPDIFRPRMIQAVAPTLRIWMGPASRLMISPHY